MKPSPVSLAVKICLALPANYWIWNGSRSESPTSKDEQRYDLAGGGETKFDVTRDVTCFKMLW